MKIQVSNVTSQAVNRPPGYVEDVLSHGTITGEWIEFDDETYEQLKLKYRGDTGGCQGCGG